MSGSKGKGGARQPDQDKGDAHELAQEILDILEAVGSRGGIAQVWRKRPGKKDAYLDQVEAATLRDNPMETIKSMYGGGAYRLVLRDANNKYVPGGSINFEIEGEPKVDPAAQIEDTDTAQLLVQLAKTNQELLQAIRNPPAAAAQGNPVEMAVALMTAIQEANKPILEELFRRRAAPAAGPQDLAGQIDSFMKVAQFMRELGAGGQEGFGSVIREFGPPISQLIDLHVRTKEKELGGAAALPAAAAAPEDATPGPANRPAWYPYLQRALPTLIMWARSGKDPQLRADVVLEDLPDDQLSVIYNELQRGEDFLVEFMGAVPDALPFREWFAAFFSRIHESIDWADDDGAGPDPEETPDGSAAGSEEAP